MPPAVSETISRLAGKSGVKATMVLDRSLNTVLQTTGSFSSFRSPDAPRNPASAGPTSDTSTANEEGVDEFAAMVWSFVNSAGGLVHNLDSEVRLNHCFVLLVLSTCYCFISYYLC